MEDQVYDLNFQSTKIAREAADTFTEKSPDKPRFVIGILGPTNRTASLSPDVSNASLRNTSFETLRDAYYEQARGLVDGGVDILLPETSFDTFSQCQTFQLRQDSPLPERRSATNR